MKRFVARFVSLFALSAVTACAAQPPPPPIFCPDARVLLPAGTLTLFLPGRQDIAAEVTTAKITGIAGSCTLIKKKNLLRETFTAGFSATNGPANTQANLTLPFFVSISQGDTIISKTPYQVSFSFDGNVTTTSATSKPVRIELSNLPASGTTEILLGFQMTQEQLNYTAAHPDGT